MPATLRVKRRNKYNNRRTTVHGITFASKREAKRWGELWTLMQAGEISRLFRQRPFALSVNGVQIGKIVLDFTYEREGKTVYEDVKSTPTETRLFKWKVKHLFAQYGYKVEIVK